MPRHCRYGFGGRCATRSACSRRTCDQRPSQKPSAQDAQTLAGKPAGAFLGSGGQTKTGLIKFAHGDTKNGRLERTFSWKGACSEPVPGDSRLVVTVESTEADGFAADFNGGGTTVSLGAPVTVFDQSGSGSFYGIGFPLGAIAPSGATPLGLGFAGLNVAGADCVVNAILWP